GRQRVGKASPGGWRAVQSQYGTPSPVCVCRDNVSNQHRAGRRRGLEPAKIRMVRRTGSGGTRLRLFSRRLPIVFLIAFLFASGAQHRHTAVSDFIKVLAEIPDDFPPFGITHVALQFFQREMHDVVVMDLVGRNLIAEFKPDTMQEFDFLRGQMWSMRSKINNLILAARKIKLDG